MVDNIKIGKSVSALQRFMDDSQLESVTLDAFEFHLKHEKPHISSITRAFNALLPSHIRCRIAMHVTDDGCGDIVFERL